MAWILIEVSQPTASDRDRCRHLREPPRSVAGEFELMDAARKTMRAWLERRGGTLNDFVFPGRNDFMAHMSSRQYARLVHERVVGIGLPAQEYGTHSLRRTKASKGIQPCIPGRRSRNEPVRYDKRRYRRASRIEIMFGRLKDWRRVATRSDRCPTPINRASRSHMRRIAAPATSSAATERCFVLPLDRGDTKWASTKPLRRSMVDNPRLLL